METPEHHRGPFNPLLELLLNSVSKKLGSLAKSYILSFPVQVTRLWMDLCSELHSGPNVWSLPGSKPQ